MLHDNKPSLDELMHYGVGHDKGGHSGRYPWGSGDDPQQRATDFLDRVTKLEKEGLSQKAIAEALGLGTVANLRDAKSSARITRRQHQVAKAKELAAEGKGATEIGNIMGLNESTVRNLLNTKAEAKMNEAQVAADYIREQINKKGMVDVGVGVERELGISKEKLRQALGILQDEGYPVYSGGVPQINNPGKQTTIKVIGPPGTQHKDIYNYEDVHKLKDYTSQSIVPDPDGKHPTKFEYPKSMDSSRLSIRYAEDGGIEQDGLIEIRRGVADLNLGKSRYAQVRILVDGTHYIKGMAVYSDDLPEGKDIVFNTNKTKDKEMKDVLKKIKSDPDNPFGSLIKADGQSYYTDEKGKKQLSLINKRAEEGDWEEWSDRLPSQFLAKQNLSLIKKQLGLAIADKEEELDSILKLTNPTVKKALLNDFAESCDSKAVHLDAAALPRQKYQVILPIKSMKETEVYAPQFNDGETVALIRYPHGGTFEIPILKVNNKQKQASNMIGKAMDAVGINSKVAERLSGADFDGDTVMVIPCNSKNSKIKITSTDPLEGLKDFDPKVSYGTVEKNGKYYNKDGNEIKVMRNTGNQMGRVSNLITDMTIKGADFDELARAVRHSMTVIDAEKHKLDYKQSEIDNDIKSLIKKYQATTDETGKEKAGASTLLSRAKSETSVLKRQGSPIIDPETGKVSYKVADDVSYIDKKTGKTVIRTQKSTKMMETDDARTLMSGPNHEGTSKEIAYAEYANKMKAMANEARKVMVNTGKIETSAQARKDYAPEYDSIMAKLNTALKNAPKERHAQTLANSVVNAKKADNPDMTKAEIKKEGQRALTAARQAVGAKKENIKLTDREWEAIQAGAISETKLKQIINNSDKDVLRQLATPRATSTLSTYKVGKLRAMYNSDYSTAEIAKALGVSTSTVIKYINDLERK